MTEVNVYGFSATMVWYGTLYVDLYSIMLQKSLMHYVL